MATGVAPADLPQIQGRLQFGHSVQFNPGLVRWLWWLTEINVHQRFSTAQQALEALHRSQNAIAPIAPTTQIHPHFHRHLPIPTVPFFDELSIYVLLRS